MRRTTARALTIGVVVSLVAGVSIAAASPKFISSETVEFPGGNLVVTFDEGGQKRFTSVDYQLTATLMRTSCTTVDGVTQCISTVSEPTETMSGLTPNNGRVTGTLTLAGNAGGGTICGCSSHVDYSDVRLTNLTSGHVYRLEPISADSP